MYYTEELLNAAKEKSGNYLLKAEECLNYAFTDYGGSIHDKLFIEYMEKKYPDNIVIEETIFSGKNALIFNTVDKPDITDEIQKAEESYVLGFEKYEDYFLARERDIIQNDLEYFKTEIISDFDIISNDRFEECVYDHMSGCNITTQGVDYSESCLIQKLTNEKIIKRN